MLNGSHIIKGRWKIVRKIGQGAFGEIHEASNVATNESVAIKIERVDSKKQVLKLEVAVLKKLQDCEYVCRFITCGRYADYNYLVMELLGDNLSELRRKQIDGKFTLETTIKLGLQMLAAIEAIHSYGYLHRDIKPSNFAMGINEKSGKVFIIDFGLARRYLLNTGEVRAARDSTGFRGTARYASINSHLSRDLGRRDDLWSLFYVLIEFAKGSLPWRKIKDKDQIGEMKIQYNNEELVAGLPPEFLAFMQHLQSLQYSDKPDYNLLRSLLQKMYDRTGVERTAPYDWEVPKKSTELNSTSNSSHKSSRKQRPLSSQHSNSKVKYSKVPEHKLSSKDDRERAKEGIARSSWQSSEVNNTKSSGRSKHKSSDLHTNAPLMSGNGSKQVGYISSHMDAASSPSQQKHRRSSSLPVNLKSQRSEEHNADSKENADHTLSTTKPTLTFQYKSKSEVQSDNEKGEILLDVMDKDVCSVLQLVTNILTQSKRTKSGRSTDDIGVTEKTKMKSNKHRRKHDPFSEKKLHGCCKGCTLM